MQKIFINHPGARDGRPPFWKPWGCGGCLWRTLVFLSTLFLLFFLMSRCHGSGSSPDLLALTQYFISILRSIRFLLIPANPTTPLGFPSILVAHLPPRSCRPTRPII